MELSFASHFPTDNYFILRFIYRCSSQYSKALRVTSLIRGSFHLAASSRLASTLPPRCCHSCNELHINANAPFWKRLHIKTSSPLELGKTFFFSFFFSGKQRLHNITGIVTRASHGVCDFALSIYRSKSVMLMLLSTKERRYRTYLVIYHYAVK